MYANNKSNIGELEIGDYVGLATFRLATLKMTRLAVRPIGGVYPVITSEEHIWDLISDPLIEAYIGTNNGMPHLKDGNLPVLFKVKFMTTQMDDFAYGYELGNPGEYNDGADKCRVYVAGTDGYAYANLDAATYRTTYVSPEYRSASDFGYDSRSQEEGLPDYSDGTSGIADADETNNRLSDGSWIPIRNIWDTSSFSTIFGDDAFTGLTADQATRTAWGNVWYTYVHATTTFTIHFADAADSVLGTVVDATSSLANATVDAAFTVKQLPVHKAIMLGEGALARLEVASEGNVKMYMKQKGSAGVLDPIDQRQSIGFKINTIGFKLIREECVWVFHHVPSQATATAGISLGLTGSQIVSL